MPDEPTAIRSYQGALRSVLPKAIPRAAMEFSPLPSFPYSVAVDDSVGLADAITIDWLQDRAGDSVVLADSLSRAVTAARSISDAVVLADARSLDQGESLADSVVISDSAVLTENVAIGDSLAVTDSLSRAVTAARALVDTVALADAIDLALPTATFVNRSIGPMRAIYPRTIPVAQDFYGDFQPTAYVVSVTDAIALADALVEINARAAAVVDTVSLSDALTIARQKLLADVVGTGIPYGDDEYGEDAYSGYALVDAQAFAVGKVIADAVALVDTISTQASGGVNQADVVAVTDEFTRIATALRTVTESVALTDSITPIRGRFLSLSDAVAVDDSFARVTTYVRGFADSLALLDQAAVAVGLIFGDQVDVSDDQVVSLVSLDTLLGAVYTGRIAMGVNGDNGAPEQGEISDTVAGVIEEELVEV